jgi:acyl carrier protein
LSVGFERRAVHSASRLTGPPAWPLSESDLMTKSKAQILDIIFKSIDEIEGDAMGKLGRATFGSLQLNALKMDSLSLLELGMAVSAELGEEVEFLDTDANMTFDALAESLLSKP